MLKATGEGKQNRTGQALSASLKGCRLMLMEVVLITYPELCMGNWGDMSKSHLLTFGGGGVPSSGAGAQFCLSEDLFGLGDSMVIRMTVPTQLRADRAPYHSWGNNHRQILDDVT